MSTARSDRGLGAADDRLDPSRLLVVVAPHPDDEVIAFGGVVFDHVHAGGRVAIIAITDGDAYDPSATRAARRAAAALRREEQLEALAVLGVDPRSVLRLGVPDGDVTELSDEIEEVLRGVLNSLAPAGEALVVTPWRADLHPDHVATTRAVRLAWQAELFEVPIWSWHRRKELSPTWHELAVVPISDEAREAKRAALGHHRSQLTTLSGGRPPVLSSAFLGDFDRPGEIVVR